MAKGELKGINRAKYREVMRFCRSVLAGYLLYLAPETFWAPIVQLFNLIAHGLSDYARWCIIFFFPLKAFIRTFGTFFYLKGKVKIGIPGRWHQIDEGAKDYKLFDSDPKKQLNKKEKHFAEVLEKLKSDYPARRKWAEKIESFSAEGSLREVTRILAAESSGELWAESIKLYDLFDEIQSLRSSLRYTFTPSSFRMDRERTLLLPLQQKSFEQQALNLRKFNMKPIVVRQKETIYRLGEELSRASSRSERLFSLEKLTEAFEILRDEASRFHMGDNYLVPHDKTNDHSLFYHSLYRLSGQALSELEKRYRRTDWGISPILTGWSEQKRIKLFFHDAESLLTGKGTERWRNFSETFSASWGKSPIRGLVLTLLILFLTGSVLGFYFPHSGDSLIKRTVRLGYEDSFINWEREIEEVSERSIRWHPPRPFSTVQIIDGANREITIYMIMGEHFSPNPLDRLLSRLSGQLGTKFEIVELEISYRPENAEAWSLYNGDGKGDRRLLRDLSELTEEWRNRRGNEETSLSNEAFDNYFRELDRRGIIEEFLRRTFSQTAFSTNIHYGSLTERYDAGFSAVLGEFERAVDIKKSDLLVSTEEAEELERSLGQASDLVRDLRESVKEQVRLEYDSLRSNPQLLEQLVRSPYANAQKLKDFETIWISLLNYIQYLYKQKELSERLSGGFVDMSLREEALKLYPLQLNLAQYLQENSFIRELIHIESISFKNRVIGLTEFTRYQEKWKETI